jgi:hypothetical protein
MVLSIALLPAVLFAARRLFARFSKSESRKLDRVVDEVAALVEGSDRADPGQAGAT